MGITYKYDILDVSKHQGTIDWKKVYASNRFQGVIIRAGYGKVATQIDTKFVTNLNGAISAGFKHIGVYWYSYAGTVADGLLEVQACLKVINPYKDKIDLPVFFDQEYETAIINATTEVRTAICKTFCDNIRNAGYRPGLYASKDWLENRLNVDQIGSDVKIWVAQYNNTGCTYYGKYSMWQYSSTGKVDGITTNIDMNKATEDIMPNTTETSNNTTDHVTDSTTNVSRWKNVNNKWYHFNADGKMDTGWKKISGCWYYFLTKDDATKLNLSEGVCFSMDTSHAVIK